jgi:hypothetical protein
MARLTCIPGGNGKCQVLLTNIGSNAVPVQTTQDGVALTNQFLETVVTGGDPCVVNSNPPSNNVVIWERLHWFLAGKSEI